MDSGHRFYRILSILLLAVLPFFSVVSPSGKAETPPVPLSDLNQALAPFPANWTTVSQQLSAHYTAGVAYHNGYIYVAGGHDGTSKTSTVEYAPVNGDGSLGGWQFTSALQTPRYTTTAVATQGHVYVIGGQHDIDPSWLNTVEMAPILPGGALGAWNYTSPLNIARDNLAAVQVGGYIYALGGTTEGWIDLGTVEYAPIQPDGQLGPWTQLEDFNTGRKALTVASNGSYIYVIGGGYGNLASPYPNVERAIVNADGTLGPWVHEASLNEGRAYATAVVYNDKLIVMGGLSASGILSSVEVSTIQADGTLSAWEFAQPMLTSRYGSGSAVVGDHVFMTGGIVPPGCSTSCPINMNVDRADLTSTCTGGGTSAPVDVVLVIDRSLSMVQEIGEAKAAASGFIDRMDLSQDQVGVVSFGSDATLDAILTHDGLAAKNAINALIANGGTNMAEAIQLAQAELVSARHNPAATPVMILMSDGVPSNTDLALSQAQAAKNSGTRIFTIGLGQDVNATLLTQIASSPSDYYYAPTSTELGAIYQTIAGVVTCNSYAPTWTLMYYLDGDNNLDWAYPAIVNALEKAASNPNVQIVALWDRAGIGNSAYFKIQPDADLNKLAPYTANVNYWHMGELNMGDPGTLTNFINWARTTFPAANTALILDNHGIGLGGGMVDDSSSGPCTSRKVDCLRVSELGSALNSATNNGADKLDIVYMNACIMGLIEDAYQIRNTASYYVASEAIMWFSNQPFAYFAPAASITASTTPDQLTSLFVLSYAQDPGIGVYPYTISAINLTMLDPLVSSLNNLSLNLKSNMVAYAPRLQTIATQVQRFEMDGDDKITPQDQYMDIYDFARLVHLNYPENANLQSAAQQVMDYLNLTVVAERHSSRNYRGNYWNHDNSHGLSIFFPARSSSYYSDANYDFALGASWLLPNARPAILTETSPDWASLLVSYIQTVNPSAPDDPAPPDPQPKIPIFTIFVPILY